MGGGTVPSFPVKSCSSCVGFAFSPYTKVAPMGAADYMGFLSPKFARKHWRTLLIVCLYCRAVCVWCWLDCNREICMFLCVIVRPTLCSSGAYTNVFAVVANRRRIDDRRLTDVSNFLYARTTTVVCRSETDMCKLVRKANRIRSAFCSILYAFTTWLWPWDCTAVSVRQWRN